MQNVTDRTSNPFDMRPPCEAIVPGYGDANADFHVVGDHPGIHGGAESGIPFTGTEAGTRLRSALADAGLLVDGVPASETSGVSEDQRSSGCGESEIRNSSGRERSERLGVSGSNATGGSSDSPLSSDGEPSNAFLSYLHMCVPDAPDDSSEDGWSEPTEADYAELEPFFDAELRAITAHVLLPVGERATRYVLENYTAIDPDGVSLADVHAEELRGSGWLVVPALDPMEWNDGDTEAYVDALRALRETDYRRESDLGRFLVGPEPYVVR